jgi:hypothetical protein
MHMRRRLPENTLTDTSRQYSAAIERFNVLSKSSVDFLTDCEGPEYRTTCYFHESVQIA